MQWIVDHQFGKRNLKKSERIILLAKVEAQIVKEAQEISHALIAAEQRIGEILLAIPTASGKRTDLWDSTGEC